MGIYLCSIQVAVPEDLLESSRIDAVFKHQSRRGMPEFVRGVSGSVQTGLQKLFIEHLFDASGAETAVFIA